MKTENILKLTQAGFSADQLKELDEYNIEDIQVLIDGKMTTEDIMKTLPVLSKVNPAPITPPTTPIVDDKQGEQTPAPNSPVDPINSLAEEIKTLRAAIQASNIDKAAANAPKQLSLEDIGEGFFNGDK